MSNDTAKDIQPPTAPPVTSSMWLACDEQERWRRLDERLQIHERILRRVNEMALGAGLTATVALVIIVAKWIAG